MVRDGVGPNKSLTLTITPQLTMIITLKPNQPNYIGLGNGRVELTANKQSALLCVLNKSLLFCKQKL